MQNTGFGEKLGVNDASFKYFQPRLRAIVKFRGWLGPSYFRRGIELLAIGSTRINATVPALRKGCEGWGTLSRS